MARDEVYLRGIYRAKVLATDAAEEDKLGRVKLEIYPMLIGEETATACGGTGIPISDLPWAVPAFSLFSGSDSDTGHFAVPDVGSYVFAFFEGADVYQPVYFAEAPNKLKGLPSERLTDYPDTKVLKTSSGIIVSINQKSGSENVKVEHPSGSSAEIDPNGDILITGNVIITGNASITGDVTGNNFNSSGISVDFNTHIHTGDDGGNTGPPK